MIKICQSGNEPGVRQALDYLGKRYGIPDGEVRGVSLAAEVGQPIAITVTVLMHEDEAPAEGPTKDGRKLIGPPHAHLDGACGDACYEPAHP
jgi:hypothetical protein